MAARTWLAEYQGIFLEKVQDFERGEMSCQQLLCKMSVLLPLHLGHPKFLTLINSCTLFLLISLVYDASP